MIAGDGQSNGGGSSKGNDDNVVVVPVRRKDPRSEWEDRVWERYRNECGNCGSDDADRLAVQMIVPEDAGGQLVPSNGILICRTCSMAMAPNQRVVNNNNRPINFWISRDLYNAIQQTLSLQHYESMGAMVRSLMALYLGDEKRFEDLEQYQDRSDADRVKINVWVDSVQYGVFQKLVIDRGMTVARALRSLIRMFQLEAEPRFESRRQ